MPIYVYLSIYKIQIEESEDQKMTTQVGTDVVVTSR